MALKKNGVRVVSATESISDDSSGRLMEYIFEGFAEYYSEELGEKIKLGHAKNAERCIANGACIPLGYRIDAINKERKYVIDEQKAPIVKEIFTKYANGMSVKEICDDLNARKLTSSKGRAFNKNSMHVMLKNERYLGIYIYDTVRIEGGMPRIIDDDLFNKVAEIMVQNKKLPARKRAKAEYLLTPKLFCGYCHEMMIGHSSNKTSKKGIKYKYYKCKKAGGSNTCTKKMVGKDSIEDKVVYECQKWLTAENIRKIAKEVMKVVNSFDDRSEIIRLEKCLKELHRAKENHTVTIRSCDNDDVRQIIIEDMTKVVADIKNVETQLEVEHARRENVSEEQVIKFLTNLANGDVTDVTYRKALIKMLVNKVYLYDDKFAIIFNAGDEEVTVDDVLLENIENELGDKKVCLLKREVQT
jgi:hypothetical protein